MGYYNLHRHSLECEGARHENSNCCSSSLRSIHSFHLSIFLYVFHRNRRVTVCYADAITVFQKTVNSVKFIYSLVT